MRRYNLIVVYDRKFIAKPQQKTAGIRVNNKSRLIKSIH